ncbi:hypothetical protein V1509DRAFT_64517 [Lipomyces kononenkoae]
MLTAAQPMTPESIPLLRSHFPTLDVTNSELHFVNSGTNLEARLPTVTPVRLFSSSVRKQSPPLLPVTPSTDSGIVCHGTLDRPHDTVVSDLSKLQRLDKLPSVRYAAQVVSDESNAPSSPSTTGDEVLIDIVQAQNDPAEARDKIEISTQPNLRNFDKEIAAANLKMAEIFTRARKSFMQVNLKPELTNSRTLTPIGAVTSSIRYLIANTTTVVKARHNWVCYIAFISETMK